MSFKELCKEKNISPSYTRMRVYDYLSKHKTHPTVDEIYKELKNELPTLSKTSVYNILNLFIEKEIVTSINVGSKESRYELLLQKHSHFKCMTCGEVFDIPYVKPIWEQLELSGFSVETEEVLLKGLCKKCNTLNA